MCLADVSKCFNSIYTHTLFWATADVQTAKDSVSQDTFSNRFDRLMQSVNFNETNGICVGPEVSRVFAELILSEVDRRAIKKIEKLGCRWKSDFEFRRYVDDFYIFARDRKVADEVLVALRLSLSDFNLHLNEEKTNIVPRPFITQKSRVVYGADQILQKFFHGFIRTAKIIDGTYCYPKKILRSQAFLRSFLEGIKANCFDNDAGYDAVSNYVIGALAGRVSAVISDYDKGILHEAVSDDDYVITIMVLLEAIYFLYNVDPTVPSSLRVAQAAIQSFNFFSEKIPARKTFISEQIVRWTLQFAKSFQASGAFKSTGCIPLEAINVLLVLGEVGREEGLTLKALHDFCSPCDDHQYFEIVSYLFCLKGDIAFAKLRGDLFARASTFLLEGPDLRLDAQTAHLALDILSCPYIDQGQRAVLFQGLRRRMDLPVISLPDAVVAVGSFEAAPWFVQWSNVNLLRMIRKKELSGVY